MATTKDEQTPAQAVEERIVLAKEVTKSELIEAYVKGANYYDLAREFFGSEGEDAIARVRQIVEAEFPEV